MISVDRVHAFILISLTVNETRVLGIIHPALLLSRYLQARVQKWT